MGDFMVRWGWPLIFMFVTNIIIIGWFDGPAWAAFGFGFLVYLVTLPRTLR